MLKTRRTTVFGIIFLAAFVLAFRMIFEKALPLFQDHFNLYFSDFLFDLLRNFPLTLLMIVADWLLVKLLLRYFEYGSRPMLRTFCEASGVFVISLVSALLVRFTQVFSGQEPTPFFNNIFFFTWLTSFIFNAVLVAGFDLFMYYGLAHKKELAQEIRQRNKAYYQYQQLKRQLNPHFLFNSLNVLDYLIHTDPEKASNYVRKMAAVYRYLLGIEDRTTVELEEEVAFVRLYVELLMQRFEKGLEVSIHIDPAFLKKKMIPCGLQMLIENAVKHNIVSPEQVLSISVRAQDGYLVTSNNIQPKIGRVESTGLGLNNIRGQYHSLFNRTIEVKNDTQQFEVRLPLID